MSWERKFESIGQRNFDDILSFWSRRSPVGIELGQSFLADHLAALAREEGLPKDGSKYIGPVDSRALVSELYCGITKSFNLSFHSQMLAKQDAFTNGSIHSFNCVIQFMFSIIALFGIFVIRIGGKYYIVDMFPWFGHRKEDNRLRKQFGEQWWNYCRVTSDTKETFEQREIILLFKRCIRMVTIVDWREFLIEGLLECPPKWFNRPRNNILYNFTGWTGCSDLMTAANTDCTKLLPAAVLSIFDVEAQMTYGPLPQSLLLAYLLLPIWEKFRGVVTMELDGQPAPNFPSVGASNLMAVFEEALERAIEKGLTV
jgi:hypothetical protein